MAKVQNLFSENPTRNDNMKASVAEKIYHKPKNSVKIYKKEIFTEKALPPAMMNLITFMIVLFQDQRIRREGYDFQL